METRTYRYSPRNSSYNHIRQIKVSLNPNGIVSVSWMGDYFGYRRAYYGGISAQLNDTNLVRMLMVDKGLRRSFLRGLLSDVRQVDETLSRDTR